MNVFVAIHPQCVIKMNPKVIVLIANVWFAEIVLIVIKNMAQENQYVSLTHAMNAL